MKELVVMDQSTEMLENLLKDSKTANAVVAFHALDARGKARFMAYLNLRNGGSPEPAKKRGRPPKAKVEGEKAQATAPKKRGRPPKAKVAGEKAQALGPLPEEILRCQGKDLVYQVAKARADEKGHTTRQAVQFPLQRAGKPEAEKATFAQIVEELKAEKKLVTDRHSWVIS